MKRTSSNDGVTALQLRIVWVFLIISLVIGLLSIVYIYTRSNKVVYVDALTLVSNYKGMQDAKIELEGKMSVYNSNLDTLKMELDEKISEYEIKKNRLPASEKKLFEELIGAKQQQFENYQQIVQEKVQNENLQLTQKVLDKINDYVKRYGKEHGYELILAATQYGNIIYGTPDVNITERIIGGLNLEYQSGSKK